VLHAHGTHDASPFHLLNIEAHSRALVSLLRGNNVTGHGVQHGIMFCKEDSGLTGHQSADVAGRSASVIATPYFVSKET